MKCLVVVPTYNEIENLEPLVRSILSQGNEFDVLIIDDNFPDGTGTVAGRLARESGRVQVLHRPGLLGLGTAYVQGFRYALAAGYEAVIEMDADFSHDPRYLPQFLDNLAQGYDVVVGSRNMSGGGVRGWPLHRRILSRGGSLYARMVLGLDVTDATGGFKAFKRAVLQEIDWDSVRSSGYSFQIELNYRVQQLGFRIAEVPIVFVDRVRGKSKMSRQIVMEALSMVLRLRAERHLPRQMPVFGRSGAEPR